jgi:type IV pilus assembly protein PilN
MIRINLLAVERERGKKRSSAVIIPAAHRVTIAASLILIGTALLIGWWFWSLRQTSIKVDEDIAKGEIETQQLRSVLAQVQKFEASKAQLQQRVTLIEQLRKGQAAPVHVLDEISKAIPERLWLTEMKQEGDVLTLSGMTTSLTGVSDLVGNLQTSPWFKKSVDIIDTQAEQNAKSGDLIKFSVKAVIDNPEAPPPLPAAGAKPPGAPKS